MTAAKIMYSALPPVTPMPKMDALSAERVAFNVKMNLMGTGGVVPGVSPEGNTEMSNMIDTICACIIKEILMFGYMETQPNIPQSPIIPPFPVGPQIEPDPIPVLDTILAPADGPGHVHPNAHMHKYPISALKFR